MPSLVGLCTADVSAVANMVNSAQRRLLMCREAGDEGWYGTWAEVAFQLISCTNPYITCPREIARLEHVTVCKCAVPIHNQFYEYLSFGNGRMPNQNQLNYGLTNVYTRNNIPTFTAMSPGPQIIRIYPTDNADLNAGRRVLLQGTDTTNSTIYSIDGLLQVEGVFVNVAGPFADAPIQFNSITGIQKDVTTGPIQIFEVDPATGDETLLLIMQPSEQVASYRRYYFNQLPNNCCCTTASTSSNLQVTALAKLELIPVAIDPDYLLIQNLEAITEECQSIRLSEADSETAKKMAAERHLQAVRMLQGELVHYLGKTDAAVNFRPFGSARLERQKIGYML